MPEIKLPQPLKHPVIACTPKELARLCAAYKSDGAERAAVARYVERAEQALKKPLVFPPRGGQHNQWYQCDKCQHHLATKSDTKHQCPRCKKVYSGPPYDDVIFLRKHSRILGNLKNAAWAYAISGEKKFAEFAAKVLLGYAERYTTYPYHDNRCRVGDKASRSGGHLFEQTLGEASNMTRAIAPAYDLIYDSGVLSDADHKAIRDGLFLPLLKNIDKHKAGKSNWQTWHNAGMLWGGAVVGRVGWVKKALTQRGNGFESQMRVSVTPDGMWYENSWGYHFYTLSAMVALAEGARRLKIDLWSHPCFKKMFTLPARYAMADGRLPRFGDDVNSSARRATWLMEPAYAAYKDAAILDLLPAKPTFDSVLFGRDVSKKADRMAMPRSELFKGAGHAILRTCGGAGLTAAFTFGPFGGSHGHFDKLSFVFFGHKRELGVDPGRAKSQAYRLPIHRQWYRATIGHNTVVVNRKSQQGAAGRAIVFAANDQYAAAGARCDVAYPGVRHARWLIMTPAYLLVLDDLAAEKKARFDWWYHSRGTRVVCSAAKEAVKIDKGYSGMAYLKRLKGGESDKTFRVRFEDEGVRTHLTLAGEASTRVWTGDGVDATIEERVPIASFTRRGTSVRFAAALEPVRGDGKPTITDLSLSEEKGAFTIVVKKGDQQDRVVVGPKKKVGVESGGKTVLSAP